MWWRWTVFLAMTVVWLAMGVLLLSNDESRWGGGLMAAYFLSLIVLDQAKVR